MVSEGCAISSREYAQGHPGTTPGSFGHTWVRSRVLPQNIPDYSRVYTTYSVVPNLVVSVILGYVAGYSHSTHPIIEGYTLHTHGTRVPNLVVLVMLGYVAG